MSIIVRVRGKQRDPKGKASNLKLEGQMRSGYPGKHRSVAYLLALAGPSQARSDRLMCSSRSEEASNRLLSGGTKVKAK